MRILIISKYFPPENSIASLRPYSWAKYWTAGGHDVTVLTTIHDHEAPCAFNFAFDGFEVKEIDFHPFYYKLKKLYKKSELKPVDKSEAINQTIGENNQNFIGQQLYKLNEFRKQKGLFMAQRLPDNMDFWIHQATKWAQQQPNWDLVVSTHAPYAAHIIAYNLKKRNHAKKWLADFRDLWTDHHIYKGLFPFTVLERYLENKILKLADVLTTVSSPLKDTLAKKYGQDRVFVIENGFDPSDLINIPDEFVFPRDNKRRLIHTGTIYKNNMDPSPLLKAINELSVDVSYKNLLQNLEVLFYGANTEVIKDLIQYYNVGQWVKIKGLAPRETILRMQRDADGLIFLEFDGGKTKGVLSGKIFEYVSSNTLIWGIGVIETSSPGQLIKEANAGILFGQNIDLIKESLISLLNNPTKIKPDLNQLVVSQFERKTLAEKLLSLATKNK